MFKKIIEDAPLERRLWIWRLRSADGYYICAFEHLCDLLEPERALQIIIIYYFFLCKYLGYVFEHI